MIVTIYLTCLSPALKEISLEGIDKNLLFNQTRCPSKMQSRPCERSEAIQKFLDCRAANSAPRNDDKEISLEGIDKNLLFNQTRYPSKMESRPCEHSEAIQKFLDCRAANSAPRNDDKEISLEGINKNLLFNQTRYPSKMQSRPCERSEAIQKFLDCRAANSAPRNDDFDIHKWHAQEDFFGRGGIKHI